MYVHNNVYEYIDNHPKSRKMSFYTFFLMVTGNVFFKSLFRSHMHYTIGKDMWQLEIVKIISMYKTVETACLRMMHLTFIHAIISKVGFSFEYLNKRIKLHVSEDKWLEDV